MKWLGPVGLAFVASVGFGGACAFSTQGLEGSGGSGTGGAVSSSSASSSSTTSSSTSSSSSTGSASSSSSSTSGMPCGSGTKPCNGMCVSTEDPAFGCGDAACEPCLNDHGTTTCEAGVCAPSCDPGFDDCNGNPKDGCEADLASTDTCGACNVACTNAHGTTACTNGACVPKCDDGFEDCNGDPSDGCEADLASTATCGACDVACTNANGTTACNGGKCVPTCAQGFRDCNGDPNDGCETQTDTDVDNCGACGRKCSTNNVAARICSGGLCTSTCVLGWANCNRPPMGPDDGCEKNVANDHNHCGGCGNSCKNPMFNDDPECDKGPATQKVCGCSNTNANECKWGPNTSPSCDTVTGLCSCSGTTCRPGEACKDNGGPDVCTCYGGPACAAGQSCCHNPLGCFDLQTDPNNCGACGHACAPGFACLGGVCSCAANDAVCGGGAPAGTFACPSIDGPDVCTCKNGTVTCANGQRCVADGSCG